MSVLDQAVEKHIVNIVHRENRPFSYRDFITFEIDGKAYRMTHGTFRNKISRLKKAGKVESDYNAGMTFYTLTGKRFGRPVTPNHMGAYHSKMDSFCKLLVKKGLPHFEENRI
jgi:hypothetical protein